MDGLQLQALCEEYGLELVVLFGSQAKGTAQEGSDFDVGVLCKEGTIPADQFLKLAYRLSQVLGVGNIDLVDLRRASPLLKYEAMRLGKLLYEFEPGAFSRFYILAWRLYQDARYDIYRMTPHYIEGALRRLSV